MKIQTKLAGKYKVAIRRGDDIIQETPWFHNTILNQGLDRMGVTAALTVISSAQVGTGTTAPSTTQTSLVAYLAGVDSGSPYPSSTVNSGSPDYKSLKTWIFTFPQGDIVGTIAEVGVGWEATSGNNLFSRELIRDSGGNPITLSLTAIDQLIVYYELTYTPVLTDGSGSVVLDSITYNYDSRILRAASFAGSVFVVLSQRLAFINDAYTFVAGTTLNAITADWPDGNFIGSGSQTSVTTAAYTPGTYYLDKTIFWDTGRANDAGGIGAIALDGSGGSGSGITYQIVFDTPIPKTNTQQLTLVVRYSWARA
jgi:hypothetical protein